MSRFRTVRRSLLTVLASAGAALAQPVESLPAAPQAALEPAAADQTAVPAMGWRYGRLTPRETRALRRDFKLPLDALVGARTAEDLAKRAVIAPLPDPHRPILAVDPRQRTNRRNPFESRVTTSFRDNPMRALGELLGAPSEDAAGAEASVGGLAETASEDLGDGPATTPSETAEASDAADDPFGAEDDPFATDGDDPFAF